MAVQSNLSDTLFARGGAAWLLVSLFLTLILVPFIENIPQSHIVLDGAISMVTATVVIAIWKRNLLRTPLVGLALVLIPVTWVSLFVKSTGLFVAHCLFASVFFWLSGALVLVLSIRHRFTSIDSVFGAISAYLLFGLGWAFMYWAIYTAVPDSFNWPAQAVLEDPGGRTVGIFSDLIYYSMVTMSTLGYGDVTPIGKVARTLSWMQSVTGQFYVAVVIAWLVSALPRNLE